MVAAAKLRRAQHAAFQARPYTKAVFELAERLSQQDQVVKHPLTLTQEKISKRDYLIFTSDRGLCGGFNSNLLRRLGDELSQCREKGIKVYSRIVGKRGRDYFKAKNWETMEAATGLYENLDRSISEELGKIASNRFEAGKTDEVWLVYNYFRSTMVQEVTFKKLLPFSGELKETKLIDTIYEPTSLEVLDSILRESLVCQIHQSFLESMASELAARMAAMDNATNNASDMISYLTLQYNRARQATITKDLMDIVNGAEALR